MNRSQDWLEQVIPVLETLNQAVIISDENVRIVFANAVFLEMLGLPAQEVVGRALIELFPPEDVLQLLRYIEQRRSAGRSRCEFYLPQPAGGRLPVLVTARQVNAPDGYAFSVVTATDITEQKRVETDLRHANTLLEARQHEIEEELLLAARVQQSLAPKTLTWGGISIETVYQPVRSSAGTSVWSRREGTFSTFFGARRFRPRDRVGAGGESDLYGNDFAN